MKKYVIALAAVIAVCTGIGVANGAGSGIIDACYAKTGGAVRIINKAQGQTCKTTESPTTWNVAGQPGPKGATGAQGVQGPAGPRGPSGYQYRWVYVNQTGFNDTPFKEATVNCPSGSYPMGGGIAAVSNQAPDGQLHYVKAALSEPTATGWRAKAGITKEWERPVWSLRVTVICAA
jgi:hypothetical protein